MKETTTQVMKEVLAEMKQMNIIDKLSVFLFLCWMRLRPLRRWMLKRELRRMIRSAMTSTEPIQEFLNAFVLFVFLASLAFWLFG